MATKSLLKDVEIKTKKLSQEFAIALENSVIKSEENRFDENTSGVDCIELKREEIKRFFNIRYKF